jgi:surface antigen
MIGNGGRNGHNWSGNSGGRPQSHPGRGGYRGPGYHPGRQPAGFRPDPRRRDFAQRRHNFYRTDHRNDIRWVHHLNVGWNSSPYYGHYGPSTRWRYNTRYYSNGYNNRQFAYYDGACRYDRNGNGSAVGALLGAIIGGAAADGDNVGAGILLGAGFGAVLGSAVSRLDDCDKVQYQYAMNYAFENGQPYYWGNPYSGVRGSIVIRDTYNYGNSECRWGDAEIYMPDGTYNYDQVRMCRDPYGDWQVARQQ